MRNLQLTAHIERDPETGLYLGMVPSIPGAHTQASSLDQLQVNLKEVVELCLEEMSDEDIGFLPEFVGLQSFSIAVCASFPLWMRGPSSVSCSNGGSNRLGKKAATCSIGILMASTPPCRTIKAKTSVGHLCARS